MDSLIQDIIPLSCLAFSLMIFICLCLGLRDLFELFFKSGGLFRRANARFGVRTMFAFTAAMAGTCSVASVAHFRHVHAMAPIVLYPFIFVSLVCGIYLIGILVTDFLEGLGWIKPKLDLSRIRSGKRMTNDDVFADDAKPDPLGATEQEATDAEE